MILLTCAVAAELHALTKPRDVRELLTGVGPVEAACAVTSALCCSRYRLVVNAGIGGALGDFPTVGDGVVVAADTMEIRLETGLALTLPDGDRTVETAHSDPTLVAALEAKGFRALRGITVSRVTTSPETANRLCAELRANVESMEGFAVLRAAQLAGVPAIQVRGISNRCGPRESSGWDFNAGIRGLQRVASALFEVA